MTSSRQTLTVVLAAKNEEQHIDAFMQNVAWADEIVVVDMMSTDRTVELAKKYTPHVFQADGGPHGLIPWNKNIAFDKATKDWILILDADERVTEGLRDEIGQLLQQESLSDEAYTIPFEQHFFGKFLRYGGWRGPIIRLFKRGTSRYGLKVAHDHLKFNGSVGALSQPIRHLSHPSIEVFLRKMNFYTSQYIDTIVQHGAGGLRDEAVGRVGPWQLIWPPTKEFLLRYVKLQGYKDGMHGFVVAVLMAMYLFVERAKVWERQYQQNNPKV